MRLFFLSILDNQITCTSFRELFVAGLSVNVEIASALEIFHAGAIKYGALWIVFRMITKNKIVFIFSVSFGRSCASCAILGI